MNSVAALPRGALAVMIVCGGLLLRADTSTNASSSSVLLIDNLGRLVEAHTNSIPKSLLPPDSMGIQKQIPTTARGVGTPREILSRSDEARQGQKTFEFFPDVPPPLMPYLSSMDAYGNTAIIPGPLIPVTPLDSVVQRGKYWLSEIGLRYSLKQTLTFVNMSGVTQGDDSIGFYTFDWEGKWAVFNAPGAESAGWLSFQIEAKTGLGNAGDTQSAQRNLGTLSDPTSIWSPKNGFRIPELAWQQSFRNGEVVIVAGMVSQGNYFDGNTYANSGRGQFLNSALINSMVMPLPGYAFGGNLEWQPVDEWYVMVGGSVGQSISGQAPWVDFDGSIWSVLGEVGYAPKDLLGLGPGVYRIQPFIANAGGPTQGGLCFNLQQQLGEHSPYAWFGRFGFGGSGATAGASAQVGTGFVMKGPLAEIGLFPSRDHDAAGIGFVWSQPSLSSIPVAHENEYVVEAGYVFHLTPTVKVQPDFQYVWNPVYNASHNRALVFQLQMDLIW
jgi:hypothetical protein